jgi:small subunit ribosomal protein S15
MARMYSRKKGKAGSTKPSKKAIPSWMRYKTKEVELLVIKLAKEEFTPSQIGLHLRDVYGIPDASAILKKKISAVLKEKSLLQTIPDDLQSLIKKSIMIKKHMEQNKQDQTAKRGLQLTESKINRLVKYYKSTKRLPSDWKYDPTKVKLIIE